LAYGETPAEDAVREHDRKGCATHRRQLQDADRERMAERVGVLGGTLQHGATADGRFVVAALLPLTAGVER
jgi:hypothetical protein